MRTSEFLDSGDYLLITGVDFKSGGVDLEHCKFVDERRYEQDKKIQLSEGSILLTKDGTLGKVAFIKSLPKPATLNAGVFNIRVINPEKLSPKFLYIYLSGPFLMDYVAKTSTGGTIQHLNQSVLRDFLVPYPKFEEQEKISSILDGVNQIITLHQRKEEELQKLKKGLLQKMFPKDGESVPEIRFPNFTDSWEHRKFGELFTFLQNNTLSRADLYPKGIAYNVHYGDVLIKYGEVIDLDVDQAEMIADDVIVKKYLKSKLQNGDLIFADTAEDETVGKTSEIQNIGNRTVISGLHTIPLRPKTEFAFGFLGFLFSSVNFRNELKPLIQGIKVSSISKNALKTLTVKISADVKEQAEISNLLLHLSHAITLHHRKTEELKKLKKALLQQMFV